MKKCVLLFSIFLGIISGGEFGYKESNPQAIAAVPGEGSYTLLYSDGTVWEGKYSEGIQSLEQVEKLKNVVKIVRMRETLYALTEEGEVYGWGSNEYGEIRWNTEEQHGGKERGTEAEDYYDIPQKLEGLENIIDLDAKVGAAFALDKKGDLCMWGIHIPPNYMKNGIPDFAEEKTGMSEKIGCLSAGVGDFHFFVRQDGSVFSLMEEASYDSQIEDILIWPEYFIFPVYPVKGRIEGSLLNISREDLRQEADSIIRAFYEAEDKQEVKLIEAEDRTVFIYQTDNTLWYWDNKLSSYYYGREYTEMGMEDYSGAFIQIDVRQILGIEEHEAVPRIIDICAGDENTLFLTETGQVFISDHIYNNEMNAYELGFGQLAWKNIVSINTDGGNQFMAVDGAGNCYYLNCNYITKTIDYNRMLH